MINVVVCFEVYYNILFLIIFKNLNSGEVYLFNNFVLNIFVEFFWLLVGGVIFYVSLERFFGKGIVFCFILIYGLYVEIC